MGSELEERGVTIVIPPWNDEDGPARVVCSANSPVEMGVSLASLDGS